MSAPPGLPLRAPATLFAGAGSSPQPAWWRGFEGQAPAHRKMRDSSVFSFFGEPCSLIFRPREHVPRWRRWCGHCLWRACWGRVFLEQRSEEHTSELQSLMRISSAVLGLKKKDKNFITSNDHIESPCTAVYNMIQEPQRTSSIH